MATFGPTMEFRMSQPGAMLTGWMMMVFSNWCSGAIVPAEFLQQFGIGLQQGLLFTAIEPVLHFKRMEFDAAADHAFDGIGEVVLAITGDLVAYIGLQTVEKNAGLPDAVNADQGHI
jgi:hypothetical protein